MSGKRISAFLGVGLLASLLMFRIGSGAPASGNRAPEKENPYEAQVKEQIRKLKNPSAPVRAGAAESLGFLRAYSASTALMVALDDTNPDVRRQAAMSLG